MVAQPLATLVSPVQTPQAEEEYEEELHPQSAGGAGGGARCCNCGGAVVFCDARIVCANMTALQCLKKTKMRHTTHPPTVPMVGRDAEGRGGLGAANGPLDGQGNQGSNPQRRRLPIHGAYYYTVHVSYRTRGGTVYRINQMAMLECKPIMACVLHLNSPLTGGSCCRHCPVGSQAW